MGIPHPAPPALFLVAVTAAPAIRQEDINEVLAGRWGEVVGESAAYQFDAFTDYYAEEMGSALVKRLVVFREPISPDALPALKLASNALESSWADDGGRRRVNLDPGYLTPLSLVLASTKPAAHRIYLRDGIYAEVTLTFEHGAFRPLPWTYPDYRTDGVRAILKEIRDRYRERLQHG